MKDFNRIRDKINTKDDGMIEQDMDKWDGMTALVNSLSVQMRCMTQLMFHTPSNLNKFAMILTQEEPDTCVSQRETDIKCLCLERNSP